LAYSKSAVDIIKHWNSRARDEFGAYAEALDGYKEKLWESGKPNNERRFADTLGGSRIYANKSERPHRGKPLNWHVQGTVADIINAASLEIIQREQAEGWQFLFPVHDSIYAIGKPQQSEELKEVIIRKAKDIGLDLSVEVQSHTVGNSQ
jgi:DNA polymerase I-like protein with 3'-5' exonuclease and polymerase domains